MSRIEAERETTAGTREPDDQGWTEPKLPLDVGEPGEQDDDPHGLGVPDTGDVIDPTADDPPGTPVDPDDPDAVEPFDHATPVGELVDLPDGDVDPARADVMVAAATDTPAGTLTGVVRDGGVLDAVQANADDIRTRHRMSPGEA